MTGLADKLFNTLTTDVTQETGQINNAPSRMVRFIAPESGQVVKDRTGGGVPSGTWWLRVHFADAEAVYLMGRFNNWSTCATPMQRLKDGTWAICLKHNPEQETFSFYVWGMGSVIGRIVRLNHKQ